MKRKTIVITLALAAITLGAQAQTSFFVKAGIGSSSYWLENADETDGKIAYGISAGADFTLAKGSHWSLRPSLSLLSKGGKVPISEYDRKKVRVDQQYVQLNMDAAYRFDLPRNMNIKITFGPYVARGVGGHVKVYGQKFKTFDDLNFKKTDAGLSVGGVFGFNRFFAGIDYHFGFTPIHSKSDGEAFPCNNIALIHFGVNL